MTDNTIDFEGTTSKTITDFEILVQSLVELKNSILEVVGAEQEYKQLQAPQKLNYALEIISEINAEFSQNILVEFSGISLSANKPALNIYKPHITFKTQDLNIEYIQGEFFNNFRVYDKECDYLYLEPTLKTPNVLSQDRMVNLYKSIHEYIAEVNTYKNENIIDNSYSNMNSSLRTYE